MSKLLVWAFNCASGPVVNLKKKLNEKIKRHFVFVLTVKKFFPFVTCFLGTFKHNAIEDHHQQEKLKFQPNNAKKNL